MLQLVSSQNELELIEKHNTELNKEVEYINKASNGKIYSVEWSRLLKDKKLLNDLREIIKNKKCN